MFNLTKVKGDPLMAAYFPPGTNNATEIYVDAGGSVEISCGAEGNPTPVITWSKVSKITKNLIQDLFQKCDKPISSSKDGLPLAEAERRQAEDGGKPFDYERHWRVRV